MKEAAEKADKAEQEKKELEEKQKAVEDTVVEVQPKQKRLKRNDLSQLDDEMTPRKQATHAGDLWAPPTRVTNEHTISYSAPGSKWERTNKKKLVLMALLERQLRDANLLPLPMSFGTVMECLDVGDNWENAFNTKVFLYLVALILHQKR